MSALALILSLALGPEGLEEDRLPRSLSEWTVAPEPAEWTTAVLVGVHLGAAVAIDGDRPGLIAGFEWRYHMLPWLGMCGGVDVLSNEEIDTISGGHFFQIPFTFTLLLYAPIDLGPFRPYGLGGGGVTITDVSGQTSGNVNLNSTELNLLYHAGFGAEFALTPTITLDVNARYVWAHDPPGAVGFSANWRQITAGVLVKLPR